MAARPTEVADIFISYSSLDRPWVKSLVERLQAIGWNVWWDRELLGGDEFDEEIDERLTSARVAIVIWSENSVRSDWVKAEAGEARQLGILVPVLKDGSRPPLVFRRYHTVDLSAWDGDPDDPAYTGLLKAITARAKDALSAGASRSAPTPPAGAGDAAGASGSSVEVGAGLAAEDLEVDEVVGEELEGAAAGAGSERVAVLKDAKLKGARIGKLTGRSIKGGPGEGESTEGGS